MVGLLNYEKDHNTEVFLGQIYSTSLIPYITTPNRITLNSRTPIDNIFSTDISENEISGNSITSVSDHLAQFLFLSIDQFNRKCSKEIYQRNCEHFD